MKKALTCLLAVILCAVTVSCVSTFGMEGDGDVGGSETSVVSLNIGDYMILGKYYDQPILWRCVDIDENGPLILSDKILCFKNFGITTLWKDSFLRKWLNSTVPEGAVEWEFGLTHDARTRPYEREKGFLHEDNFSLSERDVMKPVTQWTMLPEEHLDLSENGVTKAYSGIKMIVPGSPRDGGGPIYYQISELPEVYFGAAHQVEDTVFLLDELQIYRIWSNFGTVETTSTLEAWTNPPSYIGGRSYFLRTPSERACGEINTSGEYYLYGLGFSSGIRPAFYLDEGAAKILSGSGTEEDPYVINGKKNDKISVYCDGWELNFDVQPVNEDGRVLVPMRKIFEALGAEVSWDENTRTATAVRGDTRITLQIDSDVMYKNDAEVQLEVPARIVGDRTLIPIRAISEALGAKVEWLEESRRINITT